MLNLKPHTGYDLKKYLDTEGRFMRGVHLSQMYRTLKSMVAEGWITYDVEERNGSPDMKRYRVTAEGKEAFLKWLKSPYEPSFRFMEGDFFDRFRFASMLDREEVIGLARQELAYRRGNIEKFRHRDRTLKGLEPTDIVDPDRIQLFFDLGHEYGASAMDHYVAWLERTIERLEEEAQTVQAQ
jgi:DNA-binding PadR family transcriptional regulator